MLHSTGMRNLTGTNANDMQLLQTRATAPACWAAFCVQSCTGWQQEWLQPKAASDWGL